MYKCQAEAFVSYTISNPAPQQFNHTNILHEPLLLIQLCMHVFRVHNKFVVHYAALAVFTRSPAAYEALKSFQLLQLPSRATLQAYTGAFLDDPGI